MIGPVLAGKDLDKFRWLARKPTPHVAMVRGGEIQVEKLKNYHFGAKRWGLAGLS